MRVVVVVIVVVVIVIVVVPVVSSWRCFGGPTGFTPTKERSQGWEVEGEEDETQSDRREECTWSDGDAEEAQVGIDREEGLHGVSSSCCW